MVSERRLPLADAARLMVATAASQADAFIAAWGYKYKFNTLRPRPYIRSTIDSLWEPQIPTPHFLSIRLGIRRNHPPLPQY